MLANKLVLITSILGLMACASTKEVATSGGEDNGRKLEPPEEIFSIADITVGKSTLSEAIKIFRGGSIQKSGDAGSSVSSLCYLGKDGTTLTLESGEMGGQLGVITGVTLASKRLSSKKNCVMSTTISHETSFKQGLGLSKTIQWVRDNLGSPTKENSDSIAYTYQIKNKDGVKNKDTLSTIELKVSKGKIVEASVFQVSEYY